MPRVDIPVPGIPQPLAHYTPAARAGHLVFAAGQLASDFKGGGKKPDEAKPETKAESKAEATGETKAEAKTETKTESKPEKKKPAATTN